MGIIEEGNLVLDVTKASCYAFVGFGVDIWRSEIGLASKVTFDRTEKGKRKALCKCQVQYLSRYSILTSTFMSPSIDS
jgi:hypothetical protein